MSAGINSRGFTQCPRYGEKVCCAHMIHISHHMTLGIIKQSGARLNVLHQVHIRIAYNCDCYQHFDWL